MIHSPLAPSTLPAPLPAAARRKWSRKKAALRSKRMAGQALPRQFAQQAQQGGADPRAPAGNDLSWIPERPADGDSERRCGRW